MAPRLGIACLVTLAAGCVGPSHYAYNCNPFAVTFGGREIPSRSMAPLSAAPARDQQSTYPDGSSFPPRSVESSRLDGFGRNNAWISTANVCRQFESGVVVVRLR